jgi:hypothetical protein
VDRDPAGDFADYLHARWSRLVAALESEGVAGDAARLAVAEVLLERRRGWRRLVREGQVDVVVWQAVRERSGLPPRPDQALPDVPLPAPAPGRPDGPEEWLPRAAASLRAVRARRRRWVAAVVAGAVVVLGVLAWWDARPDPPAVRAEENPLPVVWYAGGELHLPEVVVELPGVDAFGAWRDGAVVRRASGEVVRIDGDGDLHRLSDPPEALDSPPEPPPYLPMGQYDVLVQSVPMPGGGWAHLIDSSRRVAGARDAVRGSETGRRALVVCATDRPCTDARTIVETDGSIRLR